MAKIKINAAVISNAVSKINSAKTTVGNVENGILALQRNMDTQIQSRNNISYNLSNIKSALTSLESDILKISQTVTNSVSKYETTEAQVVKLGQTVGAVASKAQKSSSRTSYESRFNMKPSDVIGSVAAAATSVNGRTFTQAYKNGIVGKDPAFPGAKGSIFDEKYDSIRPEYKGPVYNSSATKTNDKVDKPGVVDLLFNVASEAGLAGKTFSAIGDFGFGIYKGYKEDSDGEIYKTLLGGGKSFVSTVGDLAETAYKTDPDWKETLFGNWKKGSALTEIAEKTSKYSGNNTFVGLMKSEADSYMFKSANNVGENIKVGAKWAGVAVSAVTNGIDNYEEHGGMDNGRFWAETVTETVVDVAVGAAATAAVGAAAVALGISAPAVAVGAVAAGAVWAVDSLTKWATKEITGEEKGLTELVSDTVLDAGEAIIDGGKKVVSSIGKGISSFGKSIGAKWKECFG